MNVKTYPWEQRILEWAYEAFESRPGTHEPVEVEDQLLEEAYSHCEAVIKLHSRTFHMSSALLPAEKRLAPCMLFAVSATIWWIEARMICRRN